MSERRKCKFSESLKTKFPVFANGRNQYEAKCSVCDCFIKVSNKGSLDLLRHIQSEKHKKYIRIGSPVGCSKTTDISDPKLYKLSEDVCAAEYVSVTCAAEYKPSPRSPEQTADEPSTCSSAGLRVFTVRFSPDEELKVGLEDYVRSRGLSAAFVMTCVGSVRSVTLRFATQPSGPRSEKELTYKKEYFDILSLVGTVSQGGSHLHVVLGRADGTVVGGHLVGNAKVHTTAEVVIGECTAEVYVRKNDPNTTFNELEVKPRTR